MITELLLGYLEPWKIFAFEYEEQIIKAEFPDIPPFVYVTFWKEAVWPGGGQVEREAF